MLWVAVHYHGVPLVDIMHAMRAWLDKRQYQPKTFEYAISGSGTLVRVEFAEHAEAVEFAQAFDGATSQDRPLVTHRKVVEAHETRRKEGLPS